MPKKLPPLNGLRRQNLGHEVYGLASSDRKILTTRTAACFAIAFNGEMNKYKPGNLFWYAAKISKDESRMTRKTADWFLKNVILPAIPDKYKEAVVVELVEKFENSIVGDAGSSSGLLGLGPSLNSNEMPWAMVWIDPSKIPAEHALAILVMLRLPCQWADLVNYTRLIRTEYKGILNSRQSFVVACSQNKTADDHCIAFTTMGFGPKWKERMADFSFKKSLTNMRINGPTWSITSSRKKVDEQLGPDYLYRTLGRDKAYAKANGLQYVPEPSAEEVINAILGK